MTYEEWQSIDKCPKCSSPTFKNRKTGLIGCMAPQVAKCGWHERIIIPVKQKKK